MKKTLLLFLTLLLLLTGSNTIVGAETSYEVLKSQQLKELRKLKVVIDKKDLYSDFDNEFGGAYFVDDQLYFNIVKGKKEKFKNRINLPKEFIVNEVDYSQKELNEAMTVLIQNVKLINNCKISTISRDDMNNKIDINVNTDCKLTIKDFIELIGIENINIERRDSSVIASISIRMGSQIGLDDGYVEEGLSNLGTCSVAFVATSNATGKRGVVTAGHCVSSNTYFAYQSFVGGNLIGVVRQRQFSGNTDGAFIELNNNVNAQMLFTDGTSYASAQTYGIQGTAVTHYGSTSGKDTGFITSMSVTALIESTIHGDVIIQDMYKTNTILMPGDSGGALKANCEVFPGYDDVCVIGIASGFQQGVGSFFVKSSNVMNSLNLTN